MTPLKVPFRVARVPVLTLKCDADRFRFGEDNGFTQEVASVVIKVQPPCQTPAAARICQTYSELQDYFYQTHAHTHTHYICNYICRGISAGSRIRSTLISWHDPLASVCLRQRLHPSDHLDRHVEYEARPERAEA